MRLCGSVTAAALRHRRGDATPGLFALQAGLFHFRLKQCRRGLLTDSYARGPAMVYIGSLVMKKKRKRSKLIVTMIDPIAPLTGVDCR